MKVIAALVLMVTLMVSEPKMMKKIDAAIDRSYRYESDPYDVWQSYEMTKRRKAGDCEDFAIAKYRIAVDKFGMNKEDFKEIYKTKEKIKEVIIFAKKKNIKVLEDCAQSFGSMDANNKYLGTFGKLY